jgi:hypothetical protein
MWNLVLVHFKTVLMSVQDRCVVCAKSTIGKKSFWMHPTVLLANKAQAEPHFDPFGDSANLEQDRCTVCAEHIIGSKNVLDAPVGTPS